MVACRDFSALILLKSITKSAPDDNIKKRGGLKTRLFYKLIIYDHLKMDLNHIQRDHKTLDLMNFRDE